MSDSSPESFRERLRRWRLRRKQHTFVYCPTCRFELVAGGKWMGQLVTDPSIEAYACARCGTFSEWHFDSPAPILVRQTTSINREGE
jgi:hypothetical protein